MNSKEVSAPSKIFTSAKDVMISSSNNPQTHFKFGLKTGSKAAAQGFAGFILQVSLLKHITYFS